jgi:hypothetical protein
MKKFFSILMIFVVAMVFSFSEINAKPKEAPCMKKCTEPFTKCQKDAKGDKAKIEACNTAKKDCAALCEKEDKEKKDKEDKDKKDKKEVKEEKGKKK